MTGKAWLLAMALAGGTAQAQAPSGAQQAYNAGQAAFDAEDWAGAIPAFRRALTTMRSGASAAAVRSRLARALLETGAVEDAEAEARTAVAAFAKLGVTRGEDLAETHLLLGTMARYRLDEEGARVELERAVAAADGPMAGTQQLRARIGLAHAVMTRDPGAAAASLDAVLAQPAQVAMLTKFQQADLYATRARADLNRGDAKAAAVYVERALDLAGRTTTRVTVPQVRVRGDAALIYAKLGDQERVRQNLAYSGAGHLSDNGWLTRAQADLPLCGDDIRPEDVAVVEFAIDENGRTLGAAAVYASRPGGVGDAFAEAVRGWRWPPAAVKKLNAFWRSAVRVELRCVKRPRPIALKEPFRDAAEAWLAANGATVDLTDPALAKAVAAMTATAPGPRALIAMAAAAEAKGKRAEAAQAELRAALDAGNAPTDARAYLLDAAGGSGDWRAQIVRLIAEMQARRDGGRAAAWFRTELGLRSERDGKLDQARAELEQVVALPLAELPAEDPVRTLALLHVALIDKRQGKAMQADARLQGAGVSADQCSLLDVRPTPRNTSVAASVFPREAVRWSFEGTVREAFDIAADGSVTGVRTVIAYPPFVFGAASERALRDWRFYPPTLGDQALGCVGQTINVQYRLPD
jgi:tetratricopeptide (TPR) repeat protein